MGKSIYSLSVENRARVTPNTSTCEGTFFSQERFIQAVARAETANVRTLKLQAANSPAHVFALERSHGLNRRSVLLAPFGLYASPIYDHGSHDCVSALVAQLKTFRTITFHWSVRFDHSDLADRLDRCGLDRQEYTTQVLYLDRSYDAIFRGFSETARNQIRRAERKGVVVRRATERQDVRTYYALYQKMVAQRANWATIYPESLFFELVSLKDDVIFLLTEVDNKAVSGGWFFRDGNSFMYWHSVLDYEFSRYFPHYALINHAIRLASQERMSSFNMGASLGTASLEQFKSFWGTHKVPCWSLSWQNPMWASVSKVRKAIAW
jgi:hypothetical protein